VLGMVLACTAARPGARQKAEAIAALLPCVRMPQLNVHALVHGVEANALLMAQPVTCVRPRPGRCMWGAAGRACRCGASHGRHAKTRTCALERADLYRACRSPSRWDPEWRQRGAAGSAVPGVPDHHKGAAARARPAAAGSTAGAPAARIRDAAARARAASQAGCSGCRFAAQRCRVRCARFDIGSCAESARDELGEGVLPEQVQCRMQPLRHHAQGLSHHAGGCFICSASCTNIGLWQVCADSAGSGARGVMSLVH